MAGACILCTDCGGKLDLAASEATCRNCGAAFPVEHGVLIQNQTQAYYWSEVPRKALRAIIDLADKDGWDKGISRLIDEHFPGYRNIILNEARVNWINLFSRDSVKRVVEVGSGLGQTSYLLAQRHGLEVYSIEGTRERALLQGIRKMQNDLNNLHIVNADFFETRIEENSMDIVSFIGVLEWLGVAARHRSPRDTQLEALAKARSCLREGGQVCVGIENRVGINFFLGAVDHSGLRFTNLMPRWMASLYMKIRRPAFMTGSKNTEYRTYTYSRAGYRRLLEEAGFKNIRIFVAHPHYARPYCLADASASGKHLRELLGCMYKPQSIKNYIVTRLMILMSYIGLGATTAPNFIALGEK